MWAFAIGDRSFRALRPSERILSRLFSRSRESESDSLMQTCIFNPEPSSRTLPGALFFLPGFFFFTRIQQQRCESAAAGLAIARLSVCALCIDVIFVSRKSHHGGKSLHFKSILLIMNGHDREFVATMISTQIVAARIAVCSSAVHALELSHATTQIHTDLAAATAITSTMHSSQQLTAQAPRPLGQPFHSASPSFFNERS